MLLTYLHICFVSFTCCPSLHVSGCGFHVLTHTLKYAHGSWSSQWTCIWQLCPWVILWRLSIQLICVRKPTITTWPHRPRLLTLHSPLGWLFLLLCLLTARAVSSLLFCRIWIIKQLLFGWIWIVALNCEVMSLSFIIINVNTVILDIHSRSASLFYYYESKIHS